jgi:hypothetical protein
MIKKLLKQIFKPRYLLWLANLALVLPWFAIAGLAALARLNQVPDPMPALLILTLVVSVITIALGIVAVTLGFGMGLVAIVWAGRTHRLRSMAWAIVTWCALLASWVWFGTR